MTMDERDLINKLGQAELPRAELPDAKARLRRELLNAPDFDGRAGRSRGLLRARYALAAAVTIAIAGFVAVQLMPQRLSAKALIDTMEAAYESRAVAGAVHYVRQTLSIPGGYGFEIERWVHSDEDRTRIRLRDVDSREVYAHSIIEGERMYGLEAQNEGQVYGKIGRRRPDSNGGHHQKAMAIVISHTGGSDHDGAGAVLQAFVMDDAFRAESLAGTTPHDVVRDLSQSPDVIYAGATTEPALDEKIEVLERRNSGVLPFKLEFPAKYIDQVESLLMSLISEDDAHEIERRVAEFVEQNDASGEIKIKPIESVETIEVIAATSQIHRVTLVIYESGVETYRAEKVFLEDHYLPYTPDMFDPGHHGLILQRSQP